MYKKCDCEWSSVLLKPISIYLQSETKRKCYGAPVNSVQNAIRLKEKIFAWYLFSFSFCPFFVQNYSLLIEAAKLGGPEIPELKEEATE